MPKMQSGCPGQNTAYLKNFNTNLVPCPKCGEEIEFFADERKVRCKNCHSNVFKIDPEVIEYKGGDLVFYESVKSCLDWCGGCLDKKDYKDIQENNQRINSKKTDIKKLIETVEETDDEVIDFFIDAYRKSINHPKLIDPKIFDILQKEKPELFVKARNYYLNYLNEE
jgi:hypothetical protein